MKGKVNDWSTTQTNFTCPPKGNLSSHRCSLRWWELIVCSITFFPRVIHPGRRILFTHTQVENISGADIPVCFDSFCMSIPVAEISRWQLRYQERVKAYTTKIAMIVAQVSKRASAALNSSRARETDRATAQKFKNDDLTVMALIGCYLRAKIQNRATTNHRQCTDLSELTSSTWRFSGRMSVVCHTRKKDAFYLKLLEYWWANPDKKADTVRGKSCESHLKVRRTTRSGKQELK